MKKMTTILLGLTLSSTSVIAGQAHLTADSSGREYYSMPKERHQEIKTHEVTAGFLDSHMFFADGSSHKKDLTEDKYVDISLVGVLGQIKYATDGYIYLTSIGESSSNVRFNETQMDDQVVLVAETDVHTVIVSKDEEFVKIGGLNGLLRFLSQTERAVVSKKFLRMRSSEGHDFAFVVLDKKNYVIGVDSKSMSSRF